MATENMIMAAVRLGADRQEAHEIIRQHSQEAARHVKDEGGENDLLERLRDEDMFQNVDLDEVLDPMAYVGRAPEQVDRFIAEIVDPIRKRHAGSLSEPVGLRV